MLEFQEGFFEPEIREGFFVDSTMKSVWAAELEVLQAIAEVCERHGLTWYAYAGTLLGAIRHEGFVPWDDDMDIIMKREDYRKLMKVLPQELPEGFVVRSPLTEAGYTQFHTCVVNNDSISIEPEYLRKFHNCPFSVGVDIYVLDCLPRNEEKRKMQKAMLTMTGRMTTIARCLKGEREAAESDKEKTREEFLDELKYGMGQLEKFCKVKLDISPVKEERWDDLISEILALANQIAMRYDPEDGDVFVIYGPWDRWQLKKEWFQEVYAATFENFMIAIPSGYEEFLRKHYGNYQIRVKATATHEYPLYSKQLRYLREMAKCMEDKAETMDPNILPGNWRSMLNGRRVVLFSDDIQLYAEFGEKALDKLERVLSKYKTQSKEVLLWWRPQEQLKTLLGLLAREFVDRYDAILKAYKEEGWGICDESYDEDRAMEHCDEYYGGMNYIARSLKDKKPVTIERLDDEIC